MSFLSQKGNEEEMSAAIQQDLSNWIPQQGYQNSF